MTTLAAGPAPAAVGDDVLAAAFEAGGVPTAVLSLDGTVLRANRAWRALGDWAVHPGDAADRARTVAELAAGVRDSHRGRFRLLGPAGGVRWVDATSTLLRAGSGEPYALQVLLLDVTAEVGTAAELAATERTYRTMVDLAAEGIWMLDRDWVIRFANRAVAAMMGRTVDELLGRPMWDFLDDEARERARRDRERRLRGVTEVVENTLLHADGHQVWVRVNATPTRDEEGRINGSLAVLSDVTHQRAMERALAEREHRYALLVEHLPGSAVLVLDRDLRIVTAGGSAVHEFGHTAAGLVGRTVTDLVPAGDTAYLAPRLAAALAGGTSGTFEYRHSPSGRVLVIDAVPLTREGGRVGQILVAARDVTELKDAESRLAHLADHDPLTGLLNRRGFTAALRRHAALVRRYGPDGALLMVDLDEFKRVNDTYGHQGGDEVIVAVAARLLHTLRDSDVAARLGGDEFAVLLTRGGQADAETVAGRIVRAAREGSRDRAVTVSVGVALFDGSPGEIVLGNADRAMYAAKAAGRDRWCVHAGAEPPTAS